MHHRRSACDRCRAQKLRCLNPEQQGDGPCARCKRAGAVCVTSSARPLGRPRIIRKDGVNSDPRRDAPSASRELRALESAASPQMTSSPFARSVLNESSSAPFEGISWDCDLAPSWMPNDVPSFFNEFQMPVEDVFPLPEDQITTAIGADFSEPAPPVGCNGGPQHQPAMNADTLIIGPHLGANLIEGEESVQPSPPNMNNSEHSTLIGLAHLNGSITRELVRLKQYPWQAPLVQHSCHGKRLETSPNAVVEVMRSTSEFINILRRLRPSPTSPLPDPGISISSNTSDSQRHHFSPPMSYNGAVSMASLSSPTILLLLSTYMQLLELYDTIFHGVYELFGKTSNQVLGTCSGQRQSQFHVGGLGPVDGPLHVKILIQVIEHHIDLLETLIDLPAKYRLSGQSRQSRRILNNADSSELIHVVMTRQMESGRSGQSLVSSLRDGIRKVKGLL